MPAPSELKTVQARIFAYAEAINLRQGYGGRVGCALASRDEAGRPRTIGAMTNDEGRMTNASWFFNNLLDSQARTFNPSHPTPEGSLPSHPPTPHGPLP